MGRKDHVNAKISSIIGADMMLEGNVSTKDAIRIEGTVIGNVLSEGTVILSASGKIVGNLTAGDIMAGGTVEGDLSSEGRIEVASSAKITGNIRTKSLIIDENAIFEGRCIMNMNTSPGGLLSEKSELE